MLQKWKLIINNWLNCYFDKSNQNERVVNIESLLNIISHLRENLNLDESKSSVLEAHTVDEFLLEKYPEFKLANGSALESEDDIYLVASLLLFFVCVNSKDVDIKSAMCSKLSGDDQETILKFSKSLMECSPITCRDVQAAITEACGLDMATIDTGHAKVAETPPALRSLHGEVRRLQAALDAERFDRNYLQEELARTNLRLEKLVKDKEQYKLDIVNLKAKISLCCGGEHDARSSEAKAEETAKLARQLQDMEERLVHTQEMLDDAVYDRDGFKAKVEELKQERDKWVGVSQQERDRACQLAEELDAERRHMQSLRELVTELRQHNRLNGLDTSQLECDDPDASMHSLAHNLSVCSEACANVVEVQLGEERAKVEALKQQIQTLQDQIAELNQNSENNKQTYEKVLHERENEVFDLKHRINEEIEEKNNLKAHYSDKISKLNNEMNELEQRIKDNNDTSRHIIESKLQEIQTLQEEKLTLLHSLSDEITKLNNIITSLQNELETQKQSQLNMRDGYENKLMKINEKVLNRNNELVELQNTVFEKGEAIENLQMDLRKEREQSKKRIDELSERRDDLEQKYVSEKEINELLNEDKKALTQHLAAVESVRDVLLNEKTSLEKSIKDIIKEKEELLLEKEGINTLLKEEKEARNRIESEKNKLELQLNELNVNYSTEIENKQAELGKLMKDFQQLHMQFKEQEENNNILRDTLSSGLNKLIQDIESSSIADEMLLKDITNTANITMESQYNIVLNFANRLIPEMSAKKALQEALQRENDVTKELRLSLQNKEMQVTEQQAEEKRLQQIINDNKIELTKHIETLKTTIENQQKELQLLQQENQSLTNDLNDVKIQLELKVHSLKEKLVNNEDLTDKLKQTYECQIDNLNVMITKLTNYLKDKTVEFEAVRKEKDKLQQLVDENNKVIKSLEEQVKIQEQKYDKLVSDFESERQVLKNMVSVTESIMEDQKLTLNNTIAEQTRLNDELLRDNNNIKQDILALRNNYEQNILDKDTALQALHKELAEVKIEKEMLNNEIVTLKNDVQNSEEEVGKLKEDNNTLAATLQSYKDNIVSLEETNAELKIQQEAVKVELRNDIDGLTQTLRELIQHKDELNDLLKEKSDRLIDIENKLMDFGTKIIILEEEKSNLIKERDYYKTQVDETEAVLETNLTKHYEEITKMKKEIMNLTERNKKLNNGNKGLVEKSNALRNEMKELAEEIGKLKNNNGKLTEHVNKLKKEITDNVERICKLKKDNKDLVNNLKKKQAAIKSFEEQIKTEKEKYDKLVSDSESERQVLKNMVSVTESIMEDQKLTLNNTIAEQTRLNDELLRDNNNIKQDILALRNNYEQNILDKDTALQALHKELIEINLQKEILSNEIETLKNDVQDSEEQVGKLKKENNQLATSLQSYKDNIDSLEEENSNLKAELRDVVDKLTQSLQEQMDHKKQLNMQLKDKCDLIVDTENKLKNCEEKINILEEEKCNLLKEKDYCQNEVSEVHTLLEKKALKHTEEMTKLTSNNTEFAIQNSKFKKDNTHLSELIGRLKQENSELAEEVVILKKENKILVSNIEEKQSALKTLGEEVKAEKLKHEKLTSDFEAQRQVLKNMVSVTESIMEDQKLTLNNTIAEQTRLNDELLRDNNNIKQDILALRNNYEQNILDKDTALQALHKELAEVKLEKEELIKEVNSQKEALDKEIETLKSAVQRAEDEVQLLREENKNMESVVQKYKENVISLEEENSELKIKKDSIEVEFRNDVEKLTKSLQEQMENKKLINMQLQEKSDNIIEMENKLKCLEEKNNILEEEKSSLMSEKESLQGKVNEIETVLETNENRFTEEIIKLKNNSALLAENIEKNNSDSTSEINRLKTLNTALENEKDQLMQSNSDLILQVNSLKQNITDFEAQVKKLMEKNTELEEEIDKLKVNNNEIAKQVDILEAHNNELREEVNQLTNNNTKLLNNVECLKKTNTELTEQIELLNKTNNEWSDEIDQLKEDKTKLTKEVTQLNENISELKEEIDDLTDNNIELKKDIEQLKVNDNKLAVEVDKLMEKKIELTEEIDELKLSNTEAAKEINRLKKHNSDLLDEVDHLIGNKSEYESEIDKLKEQISEQSKELVLLKDHNKELTEEIEELIKNNTGMEVEIDKLRANSIALTENVDGLKGNNEELEKEIVQLKETNTKLGQEVIQFSEKNAELTEAMDKVKNDNRDQVERLNKENSEHLSENVQLKENITSLQQHITKLENGNKEIQEDMSKLRKYNTELAEEIGKLNKKKTELLEQLVQLNIVNKDLTDRLETMEKDYIKLGVTIKEKQSVIANLELAVSDSRQQNEKLRENNVNEKVSLVSKCDILENYHTKAEKELEERQKEIVSLQKEVQRLQAKVELCEEDSKAKDGFISKMSKDKDVIINNVEKELLEEKQSREKCQKKLEEKILLVAELKQKLSDINNEREALNILKKQNEDLIKAIGQRDTFAVRSQELTSCQKYSGHSADKDLRDLHHQVDNTSDLTHSSMESLKTITDLEKIIHDKNRTITALQTDVTYLKSVIAESETKLLDVTKELEVSKENCHQLSAQLKKIVHQKNEEIAELKKQVNKMSVTENRATQIIKVSAKYQAIILKRIAEIKSNTVLKELTNYGNTNNNCDNDLRRSLTAGTITMEDLENFLETTERHLKKCSEKQLALQKERDRLSELNRINESENINLKKFLTELSVSFQTISSVKDMYAQKLSRVVSLQRTVRRELLSLDGQLTDAASLRLERGYAAVLQDLAEAATTLQRWLERAVARAVSAGRIEQALLHDAERPALAPGALTSAGLDVQLDELEQALQRQLEDAARARRGDGARDPPALTVLEVRAEYEDKLNRMKAKMKQLYTEQIAVFKEKQKEKIATLERELARARDKLAQSSRAYEQHIRGLTTELWAVGEKFLTVKEEAAWFKRRERSGSLMSLQHVHSSGLVPTQEEPGRPSDTHSLRSLPVNNDVPKREGRGLHMSDEEGEVFDNRWLKELSATPRRESRGPAPGPRQSGAPQRLSELRWRNSLCPPHLKSSYPAETQFAQALDEEEIKATGASSTATQMPQRKEVGITAYKKPGPPTPSKQAGRLSATDSELRESLRVEAEPYPSRKTSTPSRLRSLFRSSKTENTEGTPRSRRLSNIFRKK
ncbi:uncharacterized protein LOC142979736 isoform X1 [Anticarsia gemmatalis]|uniref:uncharacterized protein LOC142979736 isoform X1 n=1 Tax=Anticarsia gemmatalis TaxID=129554 RepID=UPI003F75F76D